MTAIYLKLNNANHLEQVSLAENGIGVTDSSDHQASVINALINIASCQEGVNLINSITGAIDDNHRVAIAPWDSQGVNKCATIGDSGKAKVKLALALEFEGHNTITAELNAAMKALNREGQWEWLASEVCKTPIPNIIGIPNDTPSRNVHKENWIDKGVVKNWFENREQFPYPLVGQKIDDLRLILIVIFKDVLRNGAGEHSRVYWSSASNQYTDTLGNVHVRPPHISLAHELVHAYHNIRGTQTGHDIGTYSRVLYEWQCVGLGPWQHKPLTENRMRAGLHLAERDCY